VTLSLITITIRVDLEAPRNSICKELRRVDWVLLVAQLREMLQFKLTGCILGYNVAGEVNLYILVKERACRDLI
jgi:hypothetical protein